MGWTRNPKRVSWIRRRFRIAILAGMLISAGRLPEAQQVLGLLKDEEYFEFIRRDGKQAAFSEFRGDADDHRRQRQSTV